MPERLPSARPISLQIHIGRFVLETAGCNSAQLNMRGTFDIPAVREESSSGIVAICLPFKGGALAAGRFLNKSGSSMQHSKTTKLAWIYTCRPLVPLKVEVRGSN